MATTKAKDIPDGYEEIRIPRGSDREEQNLFIGLNGVNYILPKGRVSVVPKAVADEYRRSLEAQDLMDERIDEMVARAQEKNI